MSSQHQSKSQDQCTSHKPKGVSFTLLQTTVATMFSCLCCIQPHGCNCPCHRHILIEPTWHPPPTSMPTATPQKAVLTSQQYILCDNSKDWTPSCMLAVYFPCCHAPTLPTGASRDLARSFQRPPRSSEALLLLLLLLVLAAGAAGAGVGGGAGLG